MRGRLVVATLGALLPWPSYGGQAIQAGSPFISWIDRPWEYRYLLVVGTRWDEFRRVQRESLAEHPDELAQQRIEAHFDPSVQLSLPMDGVAASLSVLRLDVDRDRTVTRPTLKGVTLEARLNRLRYVVLAPKGEDPPSFTIRFGKLFIGSPSAIDQQYAPSLCDSADLRYGAKVPGRYALRFRPDAFEGYFGCRDWAAQLYDAERPYIDVTSYEPRPNVRGAKRSASFTAFIKPFIGFSRFQDKAKPVIGQHQGQWYCLTDCPPGSSPGKIEDIGAWAKANGWNAPRPPKDIRQFADRPSGAVAE